MLKTIYFHRRKIICNLLWTGCSWCQLTSGSLVWSYCWLYFLASLLIYSYELFVPIATQKCVLMVGNTTPDHHWIPWMCPCSEQVTRWAAMMHVDCPVAMSPWPTWIRLDHSNPLFLSHQCKLCVCHATFSAVHWDKFRVSLCLMIYSLCACVSVYSGKAYEYLRYGGTGSDHLDCLSDYDLHTCLLCFLTRQPDKLVVVWTRRSRRKSSKVCAEKAKT